MSQFVDYLSEALAQFGPIEARKMFGGYGIYRDGVMFGLVADDMLYLKADAESVDHFAAKGLGPFEYAQAGKTVKMSYYQAPEEIFDDPDEAVVWARRAFDAALRAHTRPKRGRKKRG